MAKSDVSKEVKRYYLLRQHNSGGAFTGPAVHVFIEATSDKEARCFADYHINLCGDSGLYSEYRRCRCCRCCGHRWMFDGDPLVNLKPHVDLARKSGLLYMGVPGTALIKSDGSMLIGNTEDKFNEIFSYILPEE